MKYELGEIEDALFDAEQAIDDARRALRSIQDKSSATELPEAVAQAMRLCPQCQNVPVNSINRCPMCRALLNVLPEPAGKVKHP